MRRRILYRLGVLLVRVGAVLAAGASAGAVAWLAGSLGAGPVTGGFAAGSLLCASAMGVGALLDRRRP